LATSHGRHPALSLPHALVYFEEARAAYWREVVGRSGLEDIDYILAEASIRWHQRVLWPARLDVALRVPLLARKHFVMEYLVTGPDGATLVSGTTTQVMYDYRAGASKRIPDQVRAAITARDGPFGAGGRWAPASAGGS
jgi:acyl-CoA thioesterase FadM